MCFLTYWMQDSASVDATANRDKLSRNPAALLTRQQQNGVSYILHCSNPSLTTGQIN